MSDEMYSIFVVNNDALTSSANEHFYKKILDFVKTCLQQLHKGN